MYLVKQIVIVKFLLYKQGNLEIRLSRKTNVLNVILEHSYGVIYLTRSLKMKDWDF